jgi:hypothetical protein
VGVPKCKVDPSQLTLDITEGGVQTWSALEWGDTIHLAYQMPACTDDSSDAQSLHYLTFQSTGAYGKDEVVVGAGDDCAAYRTPALAEGDDGKALLFYSSTVGGSDELYQCEPEGPAGAAQLTLDASSEEGEEHTTSIRLGASNLIAYVNTTPQPTGPSIGQIVTRRVGFPEQEVLSADAGGHIADLALGAFSSDSTHGGVVAWIAQGGAAPGIYARLLDKAGQPTTAPTLLSSAVGTFSNLGIRMLPKGAHAEMAGVIVYGISPRGTSTELRIRTLSLDGTIGDEQPITTGAIDAQGVGIAYYASGYALVYRVVEQAQTSLHVRVIDVLGNTTSYAELVLVAAAPLGHPAKVFVTTDGRLNVVFSDITASGTKLRVVRAICDY